MSITCVGSVPSGATSSRKRGSGAPPRLGPRRAGEAAAALASVSACEALAVRVDQAPGRAQRASATCSSSRTSMRSGHTRRSSTRRTQGSCSSSRAHLRELDGEEIAADAPARAPRSIAAASMCAGLAVDDDRAHRQRTARAPQPARRPRPRAQRREMHARRQRRSAKRALFSSRGLSHTRHLQDAHAQVLVRDTDGARRHRHQPVIGHARRGVHLEQVGLCRRGRASGRRGPSRGSRARRTRAGQRLQRPLLLLRQAARAGVARVVGEVLRLVVVEVARRLEPDQRQRLVAEDRRR